MPINAIAQNGGFTLSRSFTIADGLPSNHIYNCVEDDQGFLWVTTDAGIARFDGKRFQTFTTKDGLPDDEVMDAVKENSGRIWVNCFKQGPAYFDPVQNRFISAREDNNLSNVSGTKSINLTALKQGGVMYYNEIGAYFFINGKQTPQYLIRPGITSRIIQTFPDGDVITLGATGTPNLISKLFYLKSGKVLDSLYLKSFSRLNSIQYLLQDNKIYMSVINTGKNYRLSEFKVNPIRYRVDSFSIDLPMLYPRITPKYFTVIGANGAVLVFDKESLRHKFILSGNYFTSSLYDDSKGNIWICSIDKGLLLYKKKNIGTFATPDNFSNSNFISIARKKNGALIAGNLYGQIAETDGKYFFVHSLPKTANTSWQRKIIVSQNKVFSFGEGGSYINFTVPVLNLTGSSFFFSKTAAVLNDSIIIQAGFNGLDKLNTSTGRSCPLPTINKRTTCIGIAQGNIVYHGSTDGLYKYNFVTHHDISIAYKHPLLAERIIGICSTPDNYLWVATASNGVVALQNEIVIKVFTTANGIISNNIKCISTGRRGEIWIGTNNGITILKYNGTPTVFTYQNLTINDGLSSNIINEMMLSNDTMFCATGNGICAIPANISLPKFDIPVRITGIKINGNDTTIADNYDLEYNRNNIELQYAGIELGGHFNYFQYHIDKEPWQTLDGNTLVLQMNSGKHIVGVRAVDVNDNPGTKPLLVSFTIATPFWKFLWFWILVGFLSAGFIFWLIRRREIAKREVLLQRTLNQKKMVELELQALKSQINPHFIFNCLNSIKLLNHQQKFSEAEKYLDSFASLLRSALEQSSLKQITLQQEIDFIENYLSLEKLRLPNKLSYSIEIDKSIDTSNLVIPSMLLQPYIENAVKHGIAPLKNRHGLVQVCFYTKDNSLIAEVRDNGNGIVGSNQMNSGSSGIGIENTERRSKLYNIESQISDLKETDINLTGIMVQLKIPLQRK